MQQAISSGMFPALLQPQEQSPSVNAAVAKTVQQDDAGLTTARLDASNSPKQLVLSC